MNNPTPDDGKIAGPIPTDRALLLFAADNPGIGVCLAAFNNIFKRAGEKYEMNTSHPDFPFFLSRDFQDEPMELAIQVKHYRAPGNNKGLDHRDPAYEAGEVDFGDAVVVATGNTIELTRREWDQVELAFWNQASHESH